MLNGNISQVLAEAVQFHAPSITEFFPEIVLFEGTPFAMNRIMIIRMIMVTLLLVLFIIGTRKMKIVPGRFQGLIEMGLDLVRVNIAEDLLGKKTAVASCRSSPPSSSSCCSSTSRVSSPASTLREHRLLVFRFSLRLFRTSRLFMRD